MGDIVKLAAAPDPTPTKVEYVLSEYHFQLAPVPRLPPVCVSVVLEPTHIGDRDALIDVGATED